jgi:hypothetical protein
MLVSMQVRDETARHLIPIIGRVDELASIRRRLDQLRMGVGGLLVVVGEPGVGNPGCLPRFAG